MSRSPEDLVEALITGRGGGQLDRLVALYAPDAAIVSHRGSAHGLAEIRSFLAGYIAAHGRFDLVSIDALTVADDVILFDAVVETTAGMLQIAEVVIVGADGAVTRHVPGLRGYWGR